MSTVISACVAGSSVKHRIIIDDQSSWDEITSAIMSKLSLSSCLSIALIDADGDKMSPQLQTAQKFQKFCKVHAGESRSYFEVTGDVAISKPASVARPIVSADTSQLANGISKKSSYTRPSSVRSRSALSTPSTPSHSLVHIIKKTSTSSSTSHEVSDEDDDEDAADEMSTVASAGRASLASPSPASASPLIGRPSRRRMLGRGHSREYSGESDRASPSVSVSTSNVASGGGREEEEGASSAHTAAAQGSLSVLRHLLGADRNAINSKDSDGNTPAHCACSHKQGEVLRWLIDNGADLSVKDNVGNTPMHLLCSKGDVASLRMILAKHGGRFFDVKNNADVHLLHAAVLAGHGDVIEFLYSSAHLTQLNVVNENGLTPMHLACWENHFRVAKTLHEKGACLNIRDSNEMTPLFYACAFADVTLVRWLVVQGALIHVTNSTGDSPLHIACRNGQEDIAKYLVSAGADVNAVNKLGMTPVDKAEKSKNAKLVQAMRKLSEATREDPQEMRKVAEFHKMCALGNISGVQRLLDEGTVDVHAKNAAHSTGLHYAVRAGKNDMCEFLVRRGASVNCQERFTDMTPLHIACLKGYVDMAVWLLKRMEINLRNVSLDKRSVLHYACFSGCIELVDQLLDAGVEVNAANADECTPFHDACSAGNLDVAKVLVKRGADVWARSGYGTNALHMACKYGHVSVMEWLLDRFGDDLDKPDHRGMTPFLVACESGHLRVAKKLREVGVDVQATAYAAKHRNSAVHFACLSGSVPLVQWLVGDLHLNPNSLNSKKKTPYELCVDSEEEKCLGVRNWMKSNASRYNVNVSLSADKEDTGILDGALPLHGAAGLGNIELLDRLLENGSNVNARTARGLTPLHFACMQGQMEAVKFLVENGASVLLHDRQGQTASALATVHNHNEISFWLREQEKKSGAAASSEKVLAPSMFSCFPVEAERNSAPVRKSDRSSTPAQSGKVITADSSPVVKASSPAIASSSGPSLANQAGEQESALCDACSAGNLEQVRSLVDHDKVDVDAVCSPGSRTPLHSAVLSGNMAVLQYLLSKKARVNVQNVGGMTPVHVACDRQSSEMVLELIKKGANIATPNNAGNTPLHTIAGHGANSLLERIISLPRSVLHDIDLCVKNGEGLSLMHIAAAQNNTALVDLLAPYPGLVNSRDETHRTPLHIACGLGLIELSVKLLDHEAFINARDDGGMTPLLCACSSAHLKLAKMLVKRGASVHAESDEGGNALHYACRLGDFSMAKWLARCELDPNYKGHQDLTPLQLVDKEKYPQLMDWLLAWTLAEETGKSVEVVLAEMHQHE